MTRFIIPLLLSPYIKRLHCNWNDIFTLNLSKQCCRFSLPPNDPRNLFLAIQPYLRDADYDNDDEEDVYSVEGALEFNETCQLLKL